MAIIAVRLDEGRVNGSLAALWPSLPKTPGATASIQDFFNPLGLLPTDRSYWSYIGSITVPPCTEGVQWLFMQNPTELAQDQLQAFAALSMLTTRDRCNPLADERSRPANNRNHVTAG